MKTGNEAQQALTTKQFNKGTIINQFGVGRGVAFEKALVLNSKKSFVLNFRRTCIEFGMWPTDKPRCESTKFSTYIIIITTINTCHFIDKMIQLLHNILPI